MKKLLQTTSNNKAENRIMPVLFALALMLASVLPAKAQTTLTTAVDFTETDIHGNTYNLFTILNSGKYVCMDFYATWCVPCQNTVPYFKQAFINYGCNTSQVIFMSISLGQPPDNNAAVFAFDSTYLGGDPGYPSFSSVEGNGTAIGIAYNILALPTYILIAPNHTILEQQMYPLTSATSFDSYFSAHGLSYATCATGVSEVENASNFNVFPNPSNGEFAILLPTINSEIIVTDILGQQIIKTKATQKTISLQLNKNGIYILFVRNNQGTRKEKLIVNR